MKIAWLMLLLAILTGCGSGGGSTGNGVDPDQEPVATKAVVTVRTQAASPETVLYAVELALNLPAGVTVAALPDRTVSSGALETTIGFAAGKYVPATATAPAQVTIAVFDLEGEGFTVGSLVTLNCDISQGATVNPAGFTVSSFEASDINGVAMTGVNPRLSVQLK